MSCSLNVICIVGWSLRYAAILQIRVQGTYDGTIFGYRCDERGLVGCISLTCTLRSPELCHIFWPHSMVCTISHI